MLAAADSYWVAVHEAMFVRNWKMVTELVGWGCWEMLILEVRQQDGVQWQMPLHWEIQTPHGQCDVLNGTCFGLLQKQRPMLIQNESRIKMAHYTETTFDTFNLLNEEEKNHKIDFLKISIFIRLHIIYAGF